MRARAARTTMDRGDLLAPVLHRLNSLSQLEGDWDSYGGIPPTTIAMEQASAFCHRVAELLGPAVGERARPGVISPLANGGLQLEWQHGDALIAVDVGPDGKWGYLKKIGAGHSARYEEEDDLAAEVLLPLVREVLLPRS